MVWTSLLLLFSTEHSLDLKVTRNILLTFWRKISKNIFQSDEKNFFQFNRQFYIFLSIFVFIDFIFYTFSMLFYFILHFIVFTKFYSYFKIIFFVFTFNNLMYVNFFFQAADPLYQAISEVLTCSNDGTFIFLLEVLN